MTFHRGRKFDRFKSTDPRRGNYLLEAVLPPQEPQIKDWACRVVTDQGSEGACTGHGETVDLIASPRPDPYVDAPRANVYAYGHYVRNRQVDYWPGEAYDGSSVDATKKTSRERGYIDGWRWMTSAEQVRDAVIASGPVVLGINWYDGMYDTRPSGLVDVSGPLVGGHCLTIRGYHPAMRITGEDWYSRFEVFKWQNSWGAGYGKNGVGYLRFADLQALLADDGEAAVSWGRRQVRLP